MTNDIMMWSSCLRDLFTLELEIAYIKFTKLFEDTNYLFVMYTQITSQSNRLCAFQRYKILPFMAYKECQFLHGKDYTTEDINLV